MASIRIPKIFSSSLLGALMVTMQKSFSTFSNFNFFDFQNLKLVNYSSHKAPLPTNDNCRRRSRRQRRKRQRRRRRRRKIYGGERDVYIAEGNCITILRTKNLSVDPGSAASSPTTSSGPSSPFSPGSTGKDPDVKRFTRKKPSEHAEATSPTVYDWILISALDR